MADNGIALDLAQIGTNTEEAKSADRFVAGWRPFIGWVCGAGMAYAAIVLPVMEFVAKVGFNYAGDFPKVDWAILGQVLLGILGLGGMRTYEKTRNGK